jgi:lipid II isoglutaminyl synthase (glutamine-hydrolysing)
VTPTPRAARAPRAALAIAVVYPDLLGTYGDGGNGLVLARRASWRGIDAELIQAYSGQPLPTADIFCIGGGEDGPEVRAAADLNADGTVRRAVDHGAVVVAVCAGYQLAGVTFPDGGGRLHDGLGLLDITTRKGTGPRAVGELVATATVGAPRPATGEVLPQLTGFENHGGVTTVGPESLAVAHVVRGVGNGGGARTEGAWAGRVFGTYLHGPLLARNTAVADLLLGWAVSTTAEPAVLGPLDDAEELALRTERLAAVEVSAADRSFRRLIGRRA